MDDILKELSQKEYKDGFVTEVEQEYVPKGLNENIIRLISAKKDEPQWLLDFRLDAFRKWQKMTPPAWGHLKLPKIDFQDIIYWAAPKRDEDRPTEIDPALMETFDKLGIPLHEREALAGVKPRSNVAVDAVFDSVSVATTFRKTLAEKGIIFCSGARLGDKKFYGLYRHDEEDLDSAIFMCQFCDFVNDDKNSNGFKFFENMLKQ